VGSEVTSGGGTGRGQGRGRQRGYRNKRSWTNRFDGRHIKLTTNYCTLSKQHWFAIFALQRRCKEIVAGDLGGGPEGYCRSNADS